MGVTEDNEYGEETCPDCRGAGYYSSFDEDGNFEDGYLCPTCGGDGVVFYADE